jgi:hypothetical protein
VSLPAADGHGRLLRAGVDHRPGRGTRSWTAPEHRRRHLALLRPPTALAAPPRSRPTRTTRALRPLWEQPTGPLLDAAVDPLSQLQYAAMSAMGTRTSVLGRIAGTFPDQVRTVLHHGLRAPDQLTSFFPHPRPDDRTATVMHLLAYVGDHSSLALLAVYRDHPALGSTAADTIRRIKNRTIAEARSARHTAAPEPARHPASRECTARVMSRLDHQPSSPQSRSAAAGRDARPSQRWGLTPCRRGCTRDRSAGTPGPGGGSSS